MRAQLLLSVPVKSGEMSRIYDTTPSSPLKNPLPPPPPAAHLLGKVGDVSHVPCLSLSNQAVSYFGVLFGTHSRARLSRLEICSKRKLNGLPAVSRSTTSCRLSSYEPQASSHQSSLLSTVALALTHALHVQMQYPFSARSRGPKISCGLPK